MGWRHWRPKVPAFVESSDFFPHHLVLVWRGVQTSYHLPMNHSLYADAEHSKPHINAKWVEIIIFWGLQSLNGVLMACCQVKMSQKCCCFYLSSPNELPFNCTNYGDMSKGITSRRTHLQTHSLASHQTSHKHWEMQNHSENCSPPSSIAQYLQRAESNETDPLRHQLSNPHL